MMAGTAPAPREILTVAQMGAADAAGTAAILGFPGAATAAGGVASGTGTGQHGIVPVATMGDGIAGYFQRLRKWLEAPFAGGLSPEGVFILIGVGPLRSAKAAEWICASNCAETIKNNR